LPIGQCIVVAIINANRPVDSGKERERVGCGSGRADSCGRSKKYPKSKTKSTPKWSENKINGKTGRPK